MDELNLLELVERYLQGNMDSKEKTWFEELRKSNAEVDQMVVEQQYFLNEISRYAKVKAFKHNLFELHNELSQKGEIDDKMSLPKGKIVSIWRKYKRVVAVAASIAGVTAISISIIAHSLSSSNSESKKIQELVDKTTRIENKLNDNKKEINEVKQKINPSDKFSGTATGFLIDQKGYLATNAHVVINDKKQISKTIIVINSKGEQFRASVVKVNADKDLAILKIADDDFKPTKALPFAVRYTTADLAEPIFTLGFPKNEIVYGEGYLSAKTGFQGDTLSCQVSVDANKGNSGGPVFNRSGELIGILSSKELETQGAVFVIHTKYILQAIEEIKRDQKEISIRLSSKSSIRSLDRTEQVKKVIPFVYTVKVYN